MPVLRSARSKKLLPPLSSEPRPRSIHTLLRKISTRARVKLEPNTSMSNIDLQNMANLQSSPSEVKFCNELCEETLKELMQQREDLNIQLQRHCESNGRKDVEASKIVKKLWEEGKSRILETEQRAGYSKQSSVKGKSVLSRLTPADIKRVFEQAKKMANQMKLKRKMLVIKRQRVESKIHLAIDIVKVCRKYLNFRR